MNDLDPVQPRRSASSWRSSAWFGSQVGSTLWMVLLGIVAAIKNDLQTAAIAVVGVALLNLWGVMLWRQRRMCSMYAALQRFLTLNTLVTAVLVFSLNRNGDLPSSLFLPYWVIAVPLGLMLMFFSLIEMPRNLSSIPAP
ncbi:MAG: hypothetical protein HC818_01785 [Synechococcaceae cyanobacterium RM1_1_27]|nr:hypothetical protein [Synechococcaceae cyanobacterium RM1_1_27]